MSAPEDIYSIEWWLWSARQDEYAADKMLEIADLSPHVAAYHCQQAAEKAIKGALVWLEVEFPFTHNLETLLAMVPSDWKLHERSREISDLTGYSSRSNYPGNMALPTLDEAKAALETASFTIQTVELEVQSRST